MATGPGYLDPNGIWQFGEDDIETMFSELLNLGQEATSQQIADARARLSELEAGTGWITPTLTGSPVWQPFGSGFRAHGYRLKNGDVELRGTIKGGVGPIFTLPPGFRPAAEEATFALTNVGGADLRVNTSGVVYIAGYIAGGNNGIVSLKSLRFTPDGS